MKTAKVGISAIVGSEPNTTTYYSVIIGETKYQQSTYGGHWERLFIHDNGVWNQRYPCGNWHWRRVTSEKIISQLNTALAEHIAAQEQK
ncbi:hypothetical protein AT03_13475 [Hafnia alvei FB1]|uniref:Uncharacterized protein n=1 Tax=Hafnia alvei FB1 TaxID=1453496 RepID=A0A097R3J4_HAFAL|nr:hypothetical protein [Hafnia alvei]AIU73302.1 hypothetical protein AT03_13475 [Hafnia alvei FB1]